MKRLIIYFYHNIEECITVFFLSVMCFFVFLQIIFRYFSGIDLFSTSPILYSEEVARFSYVWITFIGLSLSTKNNENLTMSFILEKMSNVKKSITLILVNFFSLVIVFYMFIWSIKYVDFTKVMISPALELSMTIVTISLPIGFGLTIIRTTEKLFENIKEIKELK